MILNKADDISIAHVITDQKMKIFSLMFDHVITSKCMSHMHVMTMMTDYFWEMR